MITNYLSVPLFLDVVNIFLYRHILTFSKRTYADVIFFYAGHDYQEVVYTLLRVLHFRQALKVIFFSFFGEVIVCLMISNSLIYKY